MKKFMNWLQDSFAPKTTSFFARPWIAAVGSSFQVILPFILTGSLIYVYAVFRSYIPSLPGLDYVEYFTFRMMGPLVAFGVASQVMEKLGHPEYKITAGLAAIFFNIMISKPSLEDGVWLINQSRLGPTGVILGMLAGIFVAMVFRLIGKLRLFENNTSIPTFVVNWITNIIPIFLVFLFGQIVVFTLNVDIWPYIMDLFSPIQNFAESLPGFVLLAFVPAFFYSLGVSPWVWNSIRSPIYAVLMEANIAAVAAGLAATNISTSEVMVTSALLTLGGTGCTLALNIWMLTSKAKSIRTLGKVCIGPSLFNINEPIVYGAPCVFNPFLMVPMWICSLVGPVILWLAIKMGLLPVPALNVRVGQIPAPISSVLVFGTLTAVLVWAVLMILYLAIYYPFFKVWEKQTLADNPEDRITKGKD